MTRGAAVIVGLLVLSTFAAMFMSEDRERRNVGVGLLLAAMGVACFSLWVWLVP